jgi:hypothetical protein
MPDEHATRFECAGEFPDYANVVRRVREESERCEKIEHSVEALRPAGWHLPHVAPGVAKVATGSSPPGDSEQRARVIQPVHIVAGLGQQVRVPTLAARHVEDARSGGQAEQLYQARGFLAIPFGREQEAVLEEIVGVECRLPPLARFLQKKTGSR